MLTNFPTPKGYNLAGLVSFQFIHFSAIDSFAGIFDGKILTPPTLKVGETWFNGYGTIYSLNYNEKGNNNDNGKYYDQTISGFIPGDKQDLINLMDVMEADYFVLLIKDSNHQTRMVGGYGCPMVFNATFDSGSARSDSKGYTFTFSGQSTFRAPVYL